jgi:hypothetical protein
MVMLLPLTQVEAQYTQAEVKLKSGEVVKGEILQQSIGKGVTVKDDNGTTRYYSEEEIVHVKQQPGRAGRDTSGIYVRSTGMYARLSYGMGFTQQQSWWDINTQTLVSIPAFEAILGNRFSSKVNLGLGTAVRWYNDGTSIIPLFADFRGDWDIKGANKAVVPHYVVQVGYGFLGGERFDVDLIRQTGGLLTYAGLGLKMRSRGRVEWTYTIGFRRQSTEEEYRAFRDPNTLVSGIRHMQELSFDLGIHF